MKTLDTTRTNQAFSGFYFITVCNGTEYWGASRRVSRARARAGNQFGVHIAPSGRLQY